jgi:1-deoxy-D-xylulose-5-phosphate synthase
VAVAVIGDGALTGGMAFEALSHAGQLGLPLVVVLNDNKMSISPNVGALSSYLSRLSATARYQGIRSRIDRAVKGFPLIGDFLYERMVGARGRSRPSSSRRTCSPTSASSTPGPSTGTTSRDDQRVPRGPSPRQACRRPRDHEKGKGFDLAEEDPSRYHGVAPDRCLDDEEASVSSPGVADLHRSLLAGDGRDAAASTNASSRSAPP